jgi:hypothetical protein
VRATTTLYGQFGSVRFDTAAEKEMLPDDPPPWVEALVTGVLADFGPGTVSVGLHVGLEIELEESFPWGSLDTDKADPNYGRVCVRCGEPVRKGEKPHHYVACGR